MTVDRRAQLAGSLTVVEERITAACAAAGRPRSEVTLVVVTKFFPASDVALLHELGVRHVGESRHQEAVEKHEQHHDLDLVWHFIGHLQTNKSAAVGGWADVVQSVDRPKLLPGLDRAAAERGREVDVLVQVSLDSHRERGDRSGALPADAVALAEAVASAERLRLRGVMAVAPKAGDPGSAFAELRQVAERVRGVDAGATWISAGMSGDLETAITAGATHVRVGSAVLGNRPTRG